MAKPGTESGGSTGVLHIRFRAGDDERLFETLHAIEGAAVPEPHFECVFHDPGELHRVTRPKNLELLRAIAREEPTSIRETARLVDRDVRQVHRNLAELEELGLIEFEEAGRSKRPTVWYDRIAVELPLDGHDPDVAEVAK